MVDTLETTTATAGPFEALQLHQSAHSRRLRPADLDISTAEEHRIPLRAEKEKLSRRESRLGLRNIFGRQKLTVVSNESFESAGVIKGVPSPRGIRASLAELSNWPYNLHGQRSEIAQTPNKTQAYAHAHAHAHVPRPPPKDYTTPPKGNLNHKKSGSAARNQTTSPRSTQRTTWDPPPLFQAYPQAIRHAHLPASTLSAEALLRLHSQKGSISLREGLNQNPSTLQLPEDVPTDSNNHKADNKSKRKHRQNISGSSQFKHDWTTKIYVLVTSGYLLQYAGEGSFDRLPEKMLHLGKDSAAFASDVIPGRHWVLQVSSVADTDGTTSTSHAASLFSRLPFRGAEKRHASNFLMVFESAEDMDGWIATLRREIEALGGKKNLSETGKPKADDDVLQLKAQPSQRTLVVRDPDRFSKIGVLGSLSWDQSVAAQPSPGPDLHNGVESDAVRDQSFDDTSTTSGISQDGRQLDGLRDSTNRLSFISSGQRTVLTEAGSSPACSPIRDSFCSQPEELSVRDVPQEAQQPWPQPRPNASAILDRRQSMQTINHMVEMRIASASHNPRSLRPISTTYSTPWQQPSSIPHNSTPQTTPNFSVPNSVSKRYSLAKAPLSQQEDVVHAAPAAPSSPSSSQQMIGPMRPGRRPPPTALSINPRPLSFVVDQPSPRPESFRPASRSSVRQHPIVSPETAAPDTPSTFSSWGRGEDGSSQGESSPSPRRSDLPVRTSSLVHRQQNMIQVTVHTSPRRRTSMGTVRPSDRPAETTRREGRRFHLTNRAQAPTSFPPESRIMPKMNAKTNAAASAELPRSKSSLDSYGRSISPALAAAKLNSRHKRFSLHSSTSDAAAASSSSCRHSTTDSEVTITSISSHDLSIRAHTPTLFNKPAPTSSSSSSSNQHLNVDSSSQSLFGRRSMPQLLVVDGPPPAPPPTCSLPPLPPPPTCALPPLPPMALAPSSKVVMTRGASMSRPATGLRI